MSRFIAMAAVALAVALIWTASFHSRAGDDNEVEPHPYGVADEEVDGGVDDGDSGVENDGARESTPIPISLTTSGGVSLGGYQAGYLYYLTEVIKRNPDVFDPRVLTGSSAGTINSMIAVISMGNEPNDDPTKSLFYKLWTEIHFADLLDVENAPVLAMSSRRVMENLADQMEEVWVKGLDKDLDVVMGATATRVKSRSVGLSDEFSVPRQEEKFLFRIRGRGRGHAPMVTNYVDQSRGIEHPLLPFSDPANLSPEAARSDFDVIRQILFASSAFPLAFPPQEVDFCMSSPRTTSTDELQAFRDCPKAKYSEMFVDGSMFDRNPLGLAHRTARSGLEITDGTLGWKDMPDIRTGHLPENFFFMYLDAGHTSYPPSPEESKVSGKVEALFPTFGAYSQGFVRAAQAKELYTLVDENPEIRGRVEFTTRDLPAASGQLANFFGFFDRKFRIYDFYLGMHDARQYMMNKVLPRVNKMTGEEKNIDLPEDSAKRSTEKSWQPFFCLRSMIDRDKKYAGSCDGAHLEDFRILLQVSLDRVYDHCRRLPADETIDHVHCKMAMDRDSPPVVLKNTDDVDEDAWKREADESEFQHTMRLLKEYDFWFEDLGLDRDEGWLAMSRIREELLARMDEFAKKLPFGERVLLRALGKPAVNFFMYQPPKAMIYLGGGKGAELGLSVTSGLLRTRWLRFNMALQMQGLFQALSLAPNVFAITPLVGLMIEIPQLSGPVFQWRIGGRVGFQLSTADRFYRDSCDLGSFESDSARCSAPVGQLVVVFSFYERIRIQGGLEWFPYFMKPMSAHDKGKFNGMLQIGWQWISPF